MNDKSVVRNGSDSTSASHFAEEVDALRLHDRSPHPYLKHGFNVTQGDQELRSDRSLTDDVCATQRHRKPPVDLRKGASNRASTAVSATASESGTEADDERPSFVRALPAPTLRSRKGLKTGGDEYALLTPSQLDEGGEVPISNYFLLDQRLARTFSHGPIVPLSKEEEKVTRRRLNEFARRVSEIALVGVISICVLGGRGVWRTACKHKIELLSHLLISILLVLVYPIKLSFVDRRAVYSKPWQRFRVPASFDPATVLYPPVLPVLVALIVSPMNQSLLLPNVILGLASLPQRLFPRSSRLSGFNGVHWLISIAPLLLTSDQNSIRSHRTWNGFLGAPGVLPSEVLVMLYPLHHALMQPLHYLTTTSLLMTELHLLSVTLLNLLLFASTPQTTIIEACLWVGGLPLFVLTKNVLHWNVTLARVPKWKFRHLRHATRKRQSIINSVTDLINLQRAAAALRPAKETAWSEADDNEAVTYFRETRAAPLIDTKSPTKSQNDAVIQASWSAIEHYMPRADLGFDGVPEGILRTRRATLSAAPTAEVSTAQKSTRSRSRPHSILWCLQLTPDQAAWRGWLYAGYLYAVIVALVLGPVRMYVSRAALAGQEPVGWALGYLLGQIPVFRSIVHMLSLDAWIPLSAEPTSWSNLSLSMLLNMPLTRTTLGAANVRLLLIAYWALVLLFGLLTVFSLTAYVEVDTRRKVFHGTMVVMLLPSTFVDPCASALALSLILAVFLLLEVLRAGQVPPLGKAISRFVAPYVDGRDLRGPVVVSHIFLLIGCAVPLWFSLATALREGDGWELANDQRDVGMIAGVVCVGMGDAAASLVGRRYGRHKWLWVGGKSLEGSAAFVVAVTAGLLFAKVWLVAGGWRDESTGREMIALFGHSHGPAVRWTVSTIKAVFCACGASFMEAVLTGANDNVVVPVVLWLLVKGTRL
ncbi:hypothetical protein B0A48_02520 [Cryoendolithus antarcticus]|uniref:dolichol kinase n=1 Tax=Cryoendolithus antarcticus TaxID=1507870 RepID=A0A1V8TNW1_9PEZI|nr:hypothetical protein B0A48_02520 [Cryoendolithus antarcticus]